MIGLAYPKPSPGPSASPNPNQAATEPNDRTLPIPFSRTLYGYRFVGYDELLYKELLKARANNGRIDVNDLGPL